ncbi:MAG: PD-(D/E)XK nuclease family protein [Pirellulaceae bacterium]
MSVNSTQDDLVSQPSLVIKQVFFDWHTPPLQSAAVWLVDYLKNIVEHPRPLIVLPTARAGAKLNELYSVACADQNLPYLNLSTATVGELPDYLLEHEREIAPPMARMLAWVEALRQEADARSKMFPSVAHDDFARLMDIAGRLQMLHERLGADVWSFKSVQRNVREQEIEGELEKWDALAALQDAYYRELDRNNVWDPQAARNVAVRRRLCRSDRRIVLVGLADINRVTQEMLKQCAGHVTSLVFCEPGEESCFDALGCLDIGYWQHRQIAVDDSRIRFADQPNDQAEWVRRFISGVRDSSSTSRLVVGMPDEAIWPQIRRGIERAQLTYRYSRGESVSSGPVVRMMELVTQYLEEPGYFAFAELIRNPDIHDWITSRVCDPHWLEKMDAFQAALLPAEVPAHRPTVFKSINTEHFPIVAVLDAIRELITELLVCVYDEGKRRKRIASLEEWAIGWKAAVMRLYDLSPADSVASSEGVGNETSRLVNESFTRIVSVCDLILEGRHAELTLGSSRDALSLILRFVDDRVHAESSETCAVNVVGWLDLPWEPADAMVVPGVNDHVVPSTESGSSFLTNTLSRELGLSHDGHRLARDTYYLSLTNACVPNLLLLAGRRDSQKAPLLISRLLLQCNDQSLVKRSRGFFEFDRFEKQTDLQGESDRSWASSQQLMIPKPTNVPVLNRMSVTRFRDYLKCPYRFYLAVVMKLRTASDDAREMTAGQFGDLTHDCLEAFGRSEVRESDDAETIAGFLQNELDERVRRLGVASRLPSIVFQLDNMSLRLKRFAEIQAEHRKAGWSIFSVEEKFEFPFMVDDESFTIVGKIDRVDRNEEGKIAVWDYKTSEKGYSAAKAHVDSDGNWIDLQLPLYRHMIQSRFPEYGLNDVGLGYVLMPNNTRDIQFDPTDWSDQQLFDADQTVTNIIRSIRACHYWPPAEPPDYSEDWAAICQDHVFEKWSDE